MEIYLDPNKRHDFVLLFDVCMGNPNGDPDAGNMPRIDPETGHGFVTDVALKRKIRDYAVLAENKEIFIQSKSALNSLYFEAMKANGLEFPKVTVPPDDENDLIEWLYDNELGNFEIDADERQITYTGEIKDSKGINKYVADEVGDIPPPIKVKLDICAKGLVAAKKKIKSITPKERDNIKEYMVKRYYDIKMFGAVLTAGTNAGQIRGPVQLTFARSVSPVLPMDITITRVAITRESDKLNKQTEMGRKAIIPYGLYRAHGFYNPSLARKMATDGNPVTADDLKVLWEALQNMFEQDRSAARGEMACRGLYIFSHSDEKGLGNAPAHQLFESIIIDSNNESEPKRAFSDYKVSYDKKAVPLTVEMNPFSDGNKTSVIEVNI